MANDNLDLNDSSTAKDAKNATFSDNTYYTLEVKTASGTSKEIPLSADYNLLRNKPNLVVGPASSTDNAIARFDGTTGALIQNSKVIVDDSGNMSISYADATSSRSLRFTNQAGWDWGEIRFGSTAKDISYLELRTGDNANEEIRVTQYSGTTSRTAKLLDPSGNTYFPGTVYSNSKALATEEYVTNSIGALDVTDTAVSGKYVSAVSETDGKITVTRADLPTPGDAKVIIKQAGTEKGSFTLNQSGSDITIELTDSNTTYDLSGYATQDWVKAHTVFERYSATVPVAPTVSGIYTTSPSTWGDNAAPGCSYGQVLSFKSAYATDDKIRPVTQFYVSDRVGEGTAHGIWVRSQWNTQSTDLSTWHRIALSQDITSAINALDVTDTTVANQYVSAVSETDGKISVTRATLPTVGDGKITVKQDGIDDQSFTVNQTGDTTITLKDTKYYGSNTVLLNSSSGSNVFKLRDRSLDISTDHTQTYNFQKDWFEYTDKNNGHKSRFAVIRNNSSSYAYYPQYGSGIAWGESDSHGYIYTSYSNKTAYIGGGNQGRLVWYDKIVLQGALDTTLASYVKGPSSSTTNGIAVYSDTTGKIIKNRAVTINDSGVMTLTGSLYADSYSGALNLNNSNIYGINSLIFADLADDAAEGLQFWRSSSTVDSLWVKNGKIYFTPNRTLGSSGTNYEVLTTEKLGYASSGKNYKVQADTNGNLYVNVPWTDSTYGFTAGQNINISTSDNNVTISGTPYIVGSGTISSNVAYWTGTCDTITELVAGQMILYKIGNAGATTTYLNINELGNKLVRRNTGNLTNHLPAGTVVPLVYDGTYWIWADYDSGNEYTNSRLEGAFYAGEAFNKGTLLGFSIDNGKVYKITNTTVTFEPSLVATERWANRSSGATSNGLYWRAALTITSQQKVPYRYSGTTWTAQSAYIAYSTIYLRCSKNGYGLTPTANGITDQLPTFDDGYVYWQLGMMYSATGMNSMPDHPIYQWDAELSQYTRWVPKMIPIATTSIDTYLTTAGF